MAETDKPFACPLSECGMKFTNEDHLTVHKRKHDMCLSFGSGQKSNVFVADQTPTPTSFIRNCEEVGLFQDLQNVNPFEEQFKRAAESAKSGATTLHPEVGQLCGGHADDTLHTPQVYPQMDHLTIPPISRVPESPPVPVAVITSQPSITLNNENKEKKLLFSPHSENLTQQNKTETKDANVQLLLRLPDGKVVRLSAVEMPETDGTSPALIHSADILTTPSVIVDHPASCDGQSTRTVLLHGNPIPTPQPLTLNSSKAAVTDTTDKMAFAKEKLKQALTANRKVITNCKSQPNNNNNKVPIPAMKDSNSVITTAITVSSNLRDNAVVPIAATTSGGNKRTRESSGSSGHSGDDKLKRQKFLERNRASACRSRQKRKTWLKMLEHRSNVIHSTNQQLMAEVLALKEENAQLKNLLIAHRDCPVSKAMNQAGVIQIITSAEVVPEVATVSTQVNMKQVDDSPPVEVSTGVIRMVPANSTRISVPVSNVAKTSDPGTPSVIHLQPIAIPIPETSNIVCNTVSSKTNEVHQTFMLAPIKLVPEEEPSHDDLLISKKTVLEKETVIVRKIN